VKRETAIPPRQRRYQTERHQFHSRIASGCQAPSDSRYQGDDAHSRTKQENVPLLKDLSDQVVWFGNKYDSDDWKDLITALVAKSKKQEQRMAPGWMAAL
jgi:hypothetical protein